MPPVAAGDVAASAVTPVSEPVFACALSAARVPFIRWRSVPPAQWLSTPATGRPASNAGHHGSSRTLTSSVVSASGVTRFAGSRPSRR